MKSHDSFSLNLNLNLADTENRRNSAISRRGIDISLSISWSSVENPFSVLPLGVIFVQFGKGLESAVHIYSGFSFFCSNCVIRFDYFCLFLSVYLIVNWTVICGCISLLGFGLIEIGPRAWNPWK